MRINAVKKLKISAKAENLRYMREFVTKYAPKMGLNPRQINHLKLSLDEACSNVIRHAYEGVDGKKRVLVVEMINAPKYVETRVIDWGKEFRPDIEAITSPDLNKYVQLKKKGGLGLFMIKKLMDEVERTRENDANVLIMRQNVERPESYWTLLKKNLRWDQMSLRLKFSFITATAISVLLFALFYVSTFYQKKSLLQQYLYNAERTIRKISANSAPYILENQDLALTLLIKELQKKDKTVVFAGIVNAYNYIIAHTDVKMIYKKFIPPKVVNQKSKDGINIGEIKDKDLIYLTSPVKIKNLKLGEAFLAISKEYLNNEISMFQYKLKLTLITIFFWILGIIGTYMVGTIFVQPLKELADEIKRVGKEGLSGRLYFRGKGEFAEVAQAFNKMMSELKQAEIELTDTTRLKKEMQLAKSIQHTLLPRYIPKIEGYDIGAKYEAAMEVGGDYYDFFEVDKHSLGIAVGDVSGKGIGGALIMTMTRTALRLEARGNKNAASVLANLNATLEGEFKKGMYITMFYVVLDAKKRVINYASAGHNPMILFRGDTGQLYHLNPKGFAVGLDLGTPDIFRRAIKNETIKLKKGDLLFIYTDGITEAMNAKREEFGEQRLLNVIKKYHHLAANEMAEKILDEIKEFTGGYPQSDDITFVIIKEKANVSEIEYNKRIKLFNLIEKEGMSVNQACKEVGFTTSKYYRLKKIRDKYGLEALREDIDEAPRTIPHLDIEGSKKLLHLVAKHPEYSVNQLQKALNTEEYGYYKVDTKLILRELRRLNLTTIEKRKRFAKREKLLAERGKKSVFLRSDITFKREKPKVVEKTESESSVVETLVEPKSEIQKKVEAPKQEKEILKSSGEEAQQVQQEERRTDITVDKTPIETSNEVQIEEEEKIEEPELLEFSKDKIPGQAETSILDNKTIELIKNKVKENEEEQSNLVSGKPTEHDGIKIEREEKIEMADKIAKDEESEIQKDKKEEGKDTNEQLDNKINNNSNFNN